MTEYISKHGFNIEVGTTGYIFSGYRFEGNHPYLNKGNFFEQILLPFFEDLSMKTQIYTPVEDIEDLTAKGFFLPEFKDKPIQKIDKRGTIRSLWYLYKELKKCIIIDGTLYQPTHNFHDQDTEIIITIDDFVLFGSFWQDELDGDRSGKLNSFKITCGNDAFYHKTKDYEGKGWVTLIQKPAVNKILKRLTQNILAYYESNPFIEGITEYDTRTSKPDFSIEVNDGT